MNKTPKNRIIPGETIVTVYLCLLGAALPLALHDAYFDVTRTKCAVFWALTALLALVWALWRVFGKKDASLRARFSLPDLLFALFALCHVLSSLLFRPAATAFLAADNRYQGILSFALYLPLFCILRRGGRFSAPVRFALLLACSAAALVGVLELFGADPLGHRPRLAHDLLLDMIGNQLSRKVIGEGGKPPHDARQKLIDKLTREMKEAAKLLEFEHAAFLRDRIAELKGEKK